MCRITMRRSMGVEVIYQAEDVEGNPQMADNELLLEGASFEITIYDADGEAVCIQFGDGSVVVGLPLDAFLLVVRCHDCEDPNEVGAERHGPLGVLPRWGRARAGVEGLILDVHQTEWEGLNKGRTE